MGVFKACKFICFTVDTKGGLTWVEVIWVVLRGVIVVVDDFELVTTTLVNSDICATFGREIMLRHGFMLLGLMNTTLFGLLD